MKKILIFSGAIAMLVCAGCGTTSNTTQKNKSTVATTETTEEVVYKDPITYAEYETLDALTADFPEKQPGITQYQPPQAVLDSWEFRLGRTLYGIMPDSGADYALMIWRDDGEKDTQNDLMTVREALGI